MFLVFQSAAELYIFLYTVIYDVIYDTQQHYNTADKLNINMTDVKY